MEVTFSKDNTAVPAAQVAAEPQNTQVPAVAPKTGLPAKGSPILGDYVPDFKDIIIPRLNIVQNIGELNKQYPPGSLVYNQTLPLFIPPLVNPKTQVIERQATPPITLVVLGFKPTRYCEKTEGGVRGMIVDTEDQVRANGGTTDYSEWQLKKPAGMKRFEPLADALVAIERPEGVKNDGTVFIYDVEGKQYALALWGMRGAAYTAAAKRVFFTGRSLGCLTGGYWTWSFSVSTREETYKTGNRAWIPVCLPKEKTSDVFRQFVQKVLNAPTAADQ